MGKINKVSVKSQQVLAKVAGGKITKTYKKKKQEKKINVDDSLTENVQEEGVMVGLPNSSSRLDENAVKEGVAGVFKLLEQKPEVKNELFDDEIPVFLQVVSVKIAKCPNRILRLPLMHSVLNEESEICLIVPDLAGEDCRNYDRAVEYYEELLRKNDIKNINAIIPLYRVISEYDQYELRRRFADRYDLFLVDGKICGKVHHLLGKIFMKKKKMPTCVKLNSKNLKENFELAMNKVPLHIHSKGDSFTVQVGHSKMEQDKIVENIVYITSSLESQHPGGWPNIRGLFVKTATSVAIPIYYSLKSKNEVPIPIIRSKRPNAFKAIRDAVSTKYDMEVTVLPTGDIITHKPKQKKFTNNKKHEYGQKSYKKLKTGDQDDDIEDLYDLEGMSDFEDMSDFEESEDDTPKKRAPTKPNKENKKVVNSTSVVSEKKTKKEEVDDDDVSDAGESEDEEAPKMKIMFNKKNRKDSKEKTNKKSATVSLGEGNSNKSTSAEENNGKLPTRKNTRQENKRKNEGSVDAGAPKKKTVINVKEENKNDNKPAVAPKKENQNKNTNVEEQVEKLPNRKGTKQEVKKKENKNESKPLFAQKNKTMKKAASISLGKNNANKNKGVEEKDGKLSNTEYTKQEKTIELKKKKRAAAPVGKKLLR